MALDRKEIGRRIREVREQLAIPPEELASVCGVHISQIQKLEEGSLEPVPGDYILIASRLLKTDFRYFISHALDEIEEETRLVFRALGQPTPSDSQAIRRFMLFCMAEADLEVLLKIPRHPLPPDYSYFIRTDTFYKRHGVRAALKERERLHLGNGPIPNIFEILRSQGIRLFRHQLKDTHLSGVTITHPSAGICVLINYDEDLYRQFFSAAHEYCHTLFDRNKIQSEGCIVSHRFNAKELFEIRANAFAAEFLVPTDGINRYAKPRDIPELTSTIEQIARDYRVNTETVAIQLRNMDWITDKTLKSFQKRRPVTISRRDKEDPDIPRTFTAQQQERIQEQTKQGISTYYLELIRKALTEDKITEGRFAEMLDMALEEAYRFAESIGMGRQ